GASDDEGSTATAECAATSEQHVLVEEVGQNAEGHLGDVEAAGEGETVERLDVLEARPKGQTVRVHHAVHERVEDERVVRAGRESEVELGHVEATCLEVREVCGHAATIGRTASATACAAVAIRHRDRSRSSTRLLIPLASRKGVR